MPKKHAIQPNKTPLKPPALPLWFVLAGLVIAVVAMILLYRIDPANTNVYPRCFLYSSTGLTCPGCGGCRSAHQLLHGRVLTALQYNPIMVVCLPVGLYVLLAAVSHSLLGRRWPMIEVHPWMIWTFFAAIVLFGILRNLPWYPFYLLAPPGV